MDTKKIAYIILIAILIFGLFLIPSAIFSLSFTKFILSSVPYLLISGAISLLLGFTFSKNKTVAVFIFLMFLSCITIIVIFIKTPDSQKAEKAEWNSPYDSFSIDFVVGNHGHIYLNASVNDTSGLFLFDTGFGISVVNEKFMKDEKKKLHTYSITDVKGIQQTKNLYKVNSFKLGAIEIKRLQVYPKDSLTWIDPKGIFYQQDSVIGIIGNDIISKYIWDFDMINKRVIVSKSKKYCKDIPDSLSIKLIPNNGRKDIAVKINGVEKILMLDFGATSPLCISDSIPDLSYPDEKRFYSQSSMGALNHLDSAERKNSRFTFGDVELGTYTFYEIQCFENENCNLLGIPFIWTFERVVIDNMNDKSYFFAENKDFGNFGVNRYSSKNLWTLTDINHFITKPGGMVFTMATDSMETRYVFYGRLTIYQQNSKLASIFYQDSLLLSNGQILYGPATLKIESQK